MIVIAEAATATGLLNVIKKDDGKYDISIDGIVRHPSCDPDSAIRALAHYVHSSTHALTKRNKGKTP